MLLAKMEKNKEEFQKQIFQELTKLEERLSGEEMELLEKKQGLERVMLPIQQEADLKFQIWRRNSCLPT